MSRIISRKPQGHDLRVIIDLQPGETLLVVKASDVPHIAQQCTAPCVPFVEIITQPAR